LTLRVTIARKLLPLKNTLAIIAEKIGNSSKKPAKNKKTAEFPLSFYR
jgi:hypothetical protein